MAPNADGTTYKRLVAGSSPALSKSADSSRVEQTAMFHHFLLPPAFRASARESDFDGMTELTKLTEFLREGIEMEIQ